MRFYSYTLTAIIVALASSPCLAEDTQPTATVVMAKGSAACPAVTGSYPFARCQCDESEGMWVWGDGVRTLMLSWDGSWWHCLIQGDEIRFQAFTPDPILSYDGTRLIGAFPLHGPDGYSGPTAVVVFGGS